MPDTELVPVLVPKHYVLKVYGFLAQLDAIGSADDGEDDGSPLPGGTIGGADKPQWTPWTEADLRRFAATGSPTTTLIARVLDVLAARRNDKVSTTELVQRLDVDREKLRGSLSALTRHIKAHYGRRNWPMKFEWNGTEATYQIYPEVADLWNAIRS